MRLYSYWRSLATFRVRIALNIKDIPYEAIAIDLDAGDQHQAAFKAVNPQMAIPALVEDDGNVLFQSLAILEYLNEVYPAAAAAARRCARPRPRARPIADHGCRFASADRAARAQPPRRHLQPR